MMDTQRLRNLTTKRLHTEMGHVYQDLELLMGSTGLMTHMLPNALTAVFPWLWENIKDARFFDGEYDITHTGYYELPPVSEKDKVIILNRYKELPSLFDKAF